VFRAVWVEQRNMGDADTVAEVLVAAGLDAPALMALAADPQVKEALKIRTQQAVERGVFGAPTFFVGDEMFWGQDRLDFVRAALTT
jgi:2-hydroxychromene-2-carboxylate isomerase